MDKLSKCVLTGVAALGLGALWITEAPGVLRADPFETLADSVVKIHVGGGHGSGVHLGIGYSYMVPGDAICHVLGRNVA